MRLVHNIKSKFLAQNENDRLVRDSLMLGAVLGIWRKISLDISESKEIKFGLVIIITTLFNRRPEVTTTTARRVHVNEGGVTRTHEPFFFFETLFVSFSSDTI